MNCLMALCNAKFIAATGMTLKLTLACAGTNEEQEASNGAAVCVGIQVLSERDVFELLSQVCAIFIM